VAPRVFTIRAFLGAAPGSGVLYVVPAGRAFIARDLEVRNPGPAFGLSIQLGRAAPAPTHYPVQSPNIGAGTGWQWTGRLRYDAGETVGLLYVSGGPIPIISLTGYLFEDTP